MPDAGHTDRIGRSLAPAKRYREHTFAYLSPSTASDDPLKPSARALRHARGGPYPFSLTRIVNATLLPLAAPSRAFASTPTGAPTAPPNCANTSPSSPPAPKRLASFHSCYISPIVSVPIFRNIAPQSDPLHPHVGLAALAFSRLLHQVPSRVHTIAISVFHLALSVFPGRTPLPDGAHPTHIAVFTSVTDALTAVADSDSTGDFFDDLCEFAPHVASLSYLDGTQTNAALRFTASMFRLFSKQPLRSPLHLPELSGCILNVLASRRGVTGGERNRFARKVSDADANESFGSDVKSSMRARKPSGLDIGAIDISGPLGTSSQPQAEHDDFESALSALVECASTRWYPHRAAPLQALLSELERSERWTRQYSAVWNLVTHLQTLLDERSETATLPIELGRYFNHICSIMPDAATIVLKFLARLLPSESGRGVLALEELIKSLGPWYSFCQQQKHERRHFSSALNSVLDSLSCIDVDDCIFYSTLGRSLSSLHLGTEGIASQLSTVETLARLRRSRDHFDGEKLQRSDSGSSASPASDDAARIEAPIQEANSARTSKDANLQANSRSLYSRQLLEELLRLSTSTIAGARLRANRIYVEAFSESIVLSSSQLHYALSAFYMQAFGPTGEVECMLWTDKALQVSVAF